MIGLKGILFDTGIVLVLGLVTILAATLPKGISSYSRKLTAGVFGLLFLLTAGRLLAQWGSIRSLREVAPADIVRIDIDKTSITEPERIRQLAAALNDAEWYSPWKSDWGAELPMEVTLRSGTRDRFAVGFYVRGNGAVVRFEHTWGSATWMAGYAYVPNLDRVLVSAGIRRQ